MAFMEVTVLSYVRESSVSSAKSMDRQSDCVSGHLSLQYF